MIFQVKQNIFHGTQKQITTYDYVIKVYNCVIKGFDYVITAYDSLLQG